MVRSKASKKNTEKVDGKKKLTSQKIARKSAPVETGVKKKRRSRPGKAALRRNQEIPTLDWSADAESSLPPQEYI